MYLEKREDIVFLDDGLDHRDRMGWWYSPAAYIVKWTVILSLFLTFFLWITLGYVHARRRMRQGLKPLAYHRWLIPRSQRNPEENVRPYYNPGIFNMNYNNRQTSGIAEPPPVYTSDMPPSYQPPPGASKVSPEQGLPPYQSRPVTMIVPNAPSATQMTQGRRPTA